MTIEWVDELLQLLQEHRWFALDSNGRRCALLESEPLGKKVLELGIWVASGCDKICFVESDDDDWVVKIDAHYYDKEDNVAWVDRCGVEATVYEAAKAEGLSEYFAETLLYRVIDGTQVFIQEFAATDEDTIYNMFYDYCKIGFDPDAYEDEDVYEERVHSSMDYMDEQQEIQAIYGENEVSDRLITFADHYNIGDLHALNWGFTDDGRIVMIDFCSYCHDKTYNEMRWVCESRYCQV